MGIADALQQAVSSVFTAFEDDLAVACTFVSKGAAGYTPLSGVIAETDTEYAVYMIFDLYKAFEAPEGAKPNDRKGMIAKLKLTPTPKMTDEVLRNGETLQILNIQIDPADAMWVFQLRKA